VSNKLLCGFFSAARITTAQTSELGSHIAYMQKLLAIVRTKKQERSIDVTLKYTLSALWNLTDESPMTCQVFLVEGGMDLFIEVLDTFPGDKCIETKVLGLLNNIAEVPHLRSNLLKDQFLANLRYVILFEISSESNFSYKK
jgi:Zyg-11 family protein